ncbi:MAG: hypothetical protein Q4A74_07730, partial [Cardiobacteriaceae bacterium]|nr:hypothetical protein [Cardiobacteriaceae bacterium]
NADLQNLATTLDACLIPWQSLSPEKCRNALVLPLAVWDYSQNPEDYRRWLLSLEEIGAHVINPPTLQIWNMNKRYLCELADKGLAITPSLALLPDDNWQAQIMSSGWDNPVVKPLIGQSGRGVRRLDAVFPRLADYPQGILLQPFIPTDFGEVCLIYFDGHFSHAVHRRPAPQEWRANSTYGVQIFPIQAENEWLQRAAAVFSYLPIAPLYARIDGLISPTHGFLINEIELIEPALYLSLHLPAQEHLRTLLCR